MAPRKTKTAPPKHVGSGDEFKFESQYSALQVDEPATKEPLTIEDLVFDDGKVRVVSNLFPVTFEGVKETRLFLAHVPGEEGTLAAVWYVNTTTGPQMIPDHPLRIESYTDGGFRTEDGQELTYQASNRCGCGNRLKSWKPWDSHIRVVQTSRI